MLPVHVDQQARRINSQASDTIDGVEGRGNVAHQDIHRWLAVFVFQQDRNSLGCSMCHYLSDAIDKLIPGGSILALEVIVIPLCTRPDDKVCPERGGKLTTPVKDVDALSSHDI